MKYFLSGILIILSFVMTAELTADKVYTWTDENGNLHITQVPPPKKAKLKDTMDYQPKPEKEDLETERRLETGDEATLKKQKSDEVRKARADAEKAKKQAEIARGKAEEATRMAKEYIETHDRNQYERRAYEYQMEKAVEDAKAAEKQARIAQEKAIQVEKKAKLAEEQARQAVD
jgi:FtsZ-interacting cell division protein ZipA